MISKFLKIRLSVTWMKYLGAEEKHNIECDFGDKLYGKIKTSIVWGIVRILLRKTVWLQVAWHVLDEYETELNNKTECRIFPYKHVSLKKYSYRDSIKNVAWIFLDEMR